MRIGLVDVDGHNYPNYALMKISAWHKERGDSVEWADPMFGEYDRVYMSKVFTFTEDNRDIWHCEVVKGGTGYDIASKLPEEVDAMQPDYSLYGIEDVAYGFLTRGCVNKCPWCIVPKKEDAVSVYRDIDEVANGRKNVILMDNNILASEYGLEQLDKIAERCCEAVNSKVMYDVEKICELQRKLDECERFHGELLLMLINKNIKRQFVAISKQDVYFGEAILKEVKKLIEQCSTSEK